ncbi:MAG TPA: hypothetical protein VGL56_07630 [Fimbriimonadaceae bacterium]|jgi:hypothetical protein
MKTFELPLTLGANSNSRWELRVRVSPNGRTFGGTEPWFEVKLVENGNPIKETVATQPFSCFSSVMEGRRTAMMCEGGMLAIHRNGERINVQFHGSDGKLIGVEGTTVMFQELINDLAAVRH